MDAATFRADFPEFSSTLDYPDAQVNFWLGLAGQMLNTDRFADMLPFATELYTAHHLVLARKNLLSVQAGGVPGVSTVAPMSSKSVDKVSASYDTQAVTYKDAGHWNATMYGLQFYNLILMFGAGGIQL